MFTNNVDELQSQGFSVKKTRDIQTVVEHTEQFFVQGTAGEIKAPFNDETNTYMVTISGYPSDGQLSESFHRPYLPFIASLNEASLYVDEQQTDLEDDKKLAAKLFSQLAEGDTFFKVNDESAPQFTKIDEVAYRLDSSSIGASLEMYFNEDKQVYVTEMVDNFSTLTQEQKQDIVDHTPQGLDDNAFTDHVAMEIDNIAGLETLTDEDLEGLLGELLSLYKGTPA